VKYTATLAFSSGSPTRIWRLLAYSSLQDFAEAALAMHRAGGHTRELHFLEYIGCSHQLVEKAFLVVAHF